MRGVVLVAVLLAGCEDKRKKFDDAQAVPLDKPVPKEQPPDKPAPVPKVEPKDEPKVEKIGEVYTPLGQWATAGDVRVRIDGAKVGKPKLKNNFDDSDYEASSVYVMIDMKVENLSKVKKLEYGRPDFSYRRGDENLLTDEHGNDYRFGPYDLGKSVNGCDGLNTAYPGDPAFKDVLCFQPPVDAAKELRLVFRFHWMPKGEKLRFVIPAAAWKK